MVLKEENKQLKLKKPQSATLVKDGSAREVSRLNVEIDCLKKQIQDLKQSSSSKASGGVVDSKSL